MKTARINQQGLAHVGLVVLIVAVLGVIGFAGWKVMAGKKDGSNPLSRAALEAACKEEDKNICKFQASWKEQKYYTVTTKTTEDGKTSESVYRSEGKDKFHMTVGGEVNYEVVTIGNDTYTKASNGVWWKQTTKPEEVSQYKESFDFADDTEDSNAEESKDTTTYKNLGTEACGGLTCHKYQIVDSSAPDDKEYIWFDTKDYQLRRTRAESKDGAVSESTFSYGKISIGVPSPVKELGPNQYLMPGAAEPATMPDAGSMQDYMNSLPAGSGEDGSAEM